MAITLSTLPTEAAVNKTFTKIGSDMRNAEYVNTSDTAHTDTLRVKQTVLPASAKNGTPERRRTLVQFEAKMPNATVNPDVIVVNVTLTAPIGLNSTNQTELKDLASFMRTFMSANNVIALYQGQVDN